MRICVRLKGRWVSHDDAGCRPPRHQQSGLHLRLGRAPGEADVGRKKSWEEPSKETKGVYLFAEPPANF